MLDGYSVLARWYDALTSDVDYDGLAGFYDGTIAEYACDVPKKLIDLGCGTGSIATRMAARGFEVCGIDTSCEMLAAAQKKASDNRLRIKLAEQDMSKLDFGKNFGAAICTLDGINYLPDKAALGECLYRVSDSLVRGGLFIFDVNTKYKYENVIADNTFVYELDGLFLTWRNYYSKSSGKCNFYLTFFERSGNVWRRFDEYQTQKMFTVKTLSDALSEAGFTVVGTVSDISGTPVTAESERIFYICKRN